jgi:hypothetical protein
MFDIESKPSFSKKGALRIPFSPTDNWGISLLCCSTREIVFGTDALIYFLWYSII